MYACASYLINRCAREFKIKMADGLIPGLDGDLPAERGILPDSLALKKKANGIQDAKEVGDPASHTEVDWQEA